MPVAYFMGVWPSISREVGHYCRTPNGESHIRGVALSPWTDGHDPLADETPIRAAWGDLDRVDYRDRDTHPRSVQSEGIGRVLVRNGWTLLTCWDRSGDGRKNSHASFAFAEVLTPEAALAQARERFPGVWARIDAHLAARGIAFRVEAVP